MARMAEGAGRDDALAWWRKAHDLLAGMKREGRLVSKQDEGFLEQLRQKVGDPRPDRP